MKIVKWVVLGIVAVVILVVLVLYFRLDSIVKRTIETQGTAQLNTQTTLDRAALSIFGGNLSLKDLEIASPHGFTAPKMLTLGNATLSNSRPAANCSADR